MCYPLVALPLREKLAERIKDLPALLVHQFLDITPVMPPERLRWSRLLKRPVMHPAEQEESCIGTIYIEEVLPYQEAQVGGQCVHHSESIIFVERSVADLPQRLHRRDFYWGVQLHSELGRPFTEAWEAKYGYHWPRIAHKTIHPALARLFHRYWTSSSRGAGMPAIKRWVSTTGWWRRRLGASARPSGCWAT